MRWLPGLVVVLGFIMMSVGCSPNVSVTIPGCETCPERCLQEADKGKCVACLKDEHCRDNESSTKICTQDNKCICGTDNDCSSGQLCNGTGGCVECKSNKDCTTEDRSVCVSNKCAKCEPKQSRACAPEGVTVCKKGLQTCIGGDLWNECEGWTTCKAGEKCENETCVPDCPSPAPCKDGQTTCESKAGEVPGQFKTCGTDDKGCPVWKAAEACKDTEVCDKGSCVPYTCPPAECKDKDTRCDAKTHTQTCGKNTLGCLVWQTKQPCASKEFCSTATGTCVLCEPKEQVSCYSADPATKGVGECKEGTQTCASDGSGYGPCTGEVGPKTEVCGDDKDNNCDGVKDENCPCDFESKAEGVCKGSTRDAKGVCQTPKEYSNTEKCGDSLDNNCDGVVDEVCPCNYLGKSDGECGKAQSDNKGVCQAPPKYAATETCGDSLDNNCDGVVDEGCPCNYDNKADGVCKSAKRDNIGTCTKPLGYSATEICGDSLDNNCDGVVDEGCPCNYNNKTDGVCNTATRDSKGVCQAPAKYAATETCNDGFDNNCDGAIDEGCFCNYLGKKDGVCAQAQKDSNGTCLKPNNYSATEICNDNQDNNCDGIYDEGCPCNYNLNPIGECVNGKLDNLGICQPPSTYSANEICGDGLDNDCNGSADENCTPSQEVKSSIDTTNGTVDGKSTTAWNSSTGTFSFSSFKIPAGSTVRVIGTRPLIIEVTGNVQIDGVLDASGDDGIQGTGGPSSGVGGSGGKGCCGGANGGKGGNSYTGVGTRGSGPGAGGNGSARSSGQYVNGGHGGGGGHATAGGPGFNASGTGNPGSGGSSYGNTQLSSLQGGSGGGGGSGGKGGASYHYGGGGGGGGGGAVKITANGNIVIGTQGAIRANGGKGGRCQNIGAWAGGGAGSGGTIWLRAASISNGGEVSAIGGVNCFLNGGSAQDGKGGDGRIRVDTQGSVTPGGTFKPSIGFVGSK